MFRRLRAGAGPQVKVGQIVAAANDLPSGITLTANDVTLIDWPSDAPLPGSSAKLEDVVGRPLLTALGAKEPVLQRELAVVGSGIGLTAKIPQGMRATAVRSNEIVGVAGFLYPGSHVDVLTTYNLPGTNGSVTNTILQDVEVLTAGQTFEPDPQGKPAAVNVVTLLLTPEDSQKLLLASTQGSIQFVLRSGIDQKKVDLAPTRMDQLVSVPQPVVTRSVKPRPAAPPTSKVFVLEVIQGTQRSEQKF
jgi:pilus assembly protein CpaB